MIRPPYLPGTDWSAQYAFLLAQVDPNSAPSTDLWGAVVIAAAAIVGMSTTAFMREWVVPGSRFSKSESERDRLHGVIEEKVIPALESANKMQSEALVQLTAWGNQMKDLVRRIEELDRDIAELKGSRGGSGK